MHYQLLIVFVLIFPTLWTGSSYGNPIIATGEGSSKDQAVSTSMRRAVEQGLGVYIQSSTIVVNAAVLDDKIYSHSNGYVTSYRVIKEDKNADGFTVTIAATVDKTILRQDFDDVVKMLSMTTPVGNPRILVAFSNKSKDNIFKDKEFTEEVYNGIVESLTDKQFRVVDKTAAEQFSMQQADTHEIDLNFNRAAKYGLQYHAEYTLFYSLSGVIREGTIGKSVLLNLKTQLIDNTRALVVSSKSVEQAGIGQTVEQAFEKAAREGGKKIVSPMIDVLQKQWMDQLQNGAYYTIVIDGVDEPELIARFGESFEKYPLASHAREIESGGGKTTFEVRYKGKRDHLDRDLLRTARELGWNMKKVRAEGARSTWKRM